MLNRSYLCLTLFCTAACSSKSSPSAKPADQPAVGTVLPASQPVPTLTQSSILPGTTSVDPTAVAVMFIGGSRPDISGMKAALTPHFSLSDAGGQTIPIHLDIGTSKSPTLNPLLTVSPDANLQPDHWYTLVVQEDADLQVSNDRSATDVAARPLAQWSSSFFTGSAPRVRSVLRPLGPKDGAYVRIVFSEPISIEQLDIATLLSVGGKQLGKCILIGGACAASVAGFHEDTIDVLPLMTVGNTPNVFEIAMPGVVAGTSRTVGEGMTVAGLSSSMKSSSSNMISSIGANDWHDCQSGAASCWSAPAIK